MNPWECRCCKGTFFSQWNYVIHCKTSNACWNSCPWSSIGEEKYSLIWNDSKVAKRMRALFCLQLGSSQIVTGVTAAANSQPAVTSESRGTRESQARVVFACLPACLLAVSAAPIDSMSGFHAFRPPATLISVDRKKKICVLSQHSAAHVTRQWRPGVFAWPAWACRRPLNILVSTVSRKRCHLVTAWHTPLTVTDKTWKLTQSHNRRLNTVDLNRETHTFYVHLFLVTCGSVIATEARNRSLLTSL